MHPSGAAASIARRVHLAHRDKSGAPYLGHVARVAARVAGAGDDAVTVAWLHDVVEDGQISLCDLLSAGFSREVLDAVDALTRRDQESDASYVDRVVRSPLARLVKRADVSDNLDPQRLKEIPAPTRRRLEVKYAGMAELLGPLLRTSEAHYRALGCGDLAWISDWSSDSIALYDNHEMNLVTEAVTLVSKACLAQAVITPVLRSLVDPMGLIGLEHRVKSPLGTVSRLERTQQELGRLEEPKDMVRFTVLVREESMWHDAERLCTELSHEVTLNRARSFFVPGNPYYGVHTWWEGVSGLMIEIQFHSERSFIIKESTHALYEAYRDPSVPPERRLAAWYERVGAWSEYVIPRDQPDELAHVTLESRRFTPPSGTSISVRSEAL